MERHEVEARVLIHLWSHLQICYSHQWMAQDDRMDDCFCLNQPIQIKWSVSSEIKMNALYIQFYDASQ